MSPSNLLFNRACAVIVQTDGAKAIKIAPQGGQKEALSVKFTVKKDLTSKPNTAELQIYNLSPDTRLALQKLKDATVQIDAGYVGSTSTIFLGDMRTGFGAHTGPDWITTLSAGDGEAKLRTARVQTALRAGTDIATVFRALSTALGVSKGNLDAAVSAIQGAGFSSQFSLGTVLSGSAASEMDRITASVDYTWSVQGGKLQLVPRGQALAGSAILLTEKTGMIGSPTVDKDGVVSVKMLMVADVYPGRKIVLQASEIKGQYAIQETAHTGDTRGQDWYIDVKAKPY